MTEQIQRPNFSISSGGNAGLNLKLQRTCKLVEEWSEKYNAYIEKHFDGGDPRHQYGSKRHIASGAVQRTYRVVYEFQGKEQYQQAKSEAHWICNLFVKKGEGLQFAIKTLQDAGYSQAAIDEVLAAR